MTKQYIVVDENDVIVGYKERKSDIDPQKEYYRVSALRVTNSRWEILIAQRSFNKSHSPGKRWPAVAGTVEKGESYKDNILKETAEELGLYNIEIKQGPKHKIEDKYKYFTQRFTAIQDTAIEEFKIRKEELETVKWIDAETLKEDVSKHPETYVESMSNCIREFILEN